MGGDSLFGATAAGPLGLGAQSALDAAAKPPAVSHASADIVGAAEDFEAFYLTQAMQTMFSGIEADPLFGGGPGENVFRSLLNQEYGKIVARAGGIGIADSVAREIIKLQEAN